MADEASQDLHRIRYDERSEGWYLGLPAGSRLQLDRATLAHLVSLYNEIHRGNPLTLIERQVMLALGRERDGLQSTVRSLYDFIDAESESPTTGVAARARRVRAGAGLLDRLRAALLRRLEKIRVA
jgi:hypothetical protein